jgi:hypothetical protein
MKFPPENLIKIYLDGSFTEEAQVEFDRLMKQDPAFAEKVTSAVAERLGPVPETLVDQVSARLDDKIVGIWSQYKPAPWFSALKLGLKVLLSAGLAAGLYFGAKHFHSTDQTKLISQTPALDRIMSTESTTPPAVPAHRAASRQVKEKKTSAEEAVPSAQASEEGKAQTAQGSLIRAAIDLDKTQAVKVTVLDPHGLPVRHLYEGIWNAGNHQVDWDGKDAFGNPVLAGDYLVVVETGGKTLSKVVTVQQP